MFSRQYRTSARHVRQTCCRHSHCRLMNVTKIGNGILNGSDVGTRIVGILGLSSLYRQDQAVLTMQHPARSH